MMETIDWGDVIAALALLFAVYATRMTVKLGQKQNSLVDDQKRLNQLLLAREEKAVILERRADLSASLVALGGTKYRVKVFNKGDASARGVTIDFPDGNDLVMKSEVEDKFPFEVLEPRQSVDLHALVHMSTARKHRVILRWSDDHAQDNSKELFLTL